MTEPDQKAPLFDLVAKRVYIAGNAGMVGAALVCRLKAEGCKILTGSLEPANECYASPRSPGFALSKDFRLALGWREPRSLQRFGRSTAISVRAPTLAKFHKDAGAGKLNIPNKNRVNCALCLGRI